MEAREARKAEAKAKKEAERAAKDRASREAEEAKRAKEAEAKAKKEAERAAKDRASREDEEAKRAKEGKNRVKGEDEDKEAVSAELYQGIVKLTIAPPIDLGQVRKLEEYLSQVQDLRLVLIGGSVDEGTEIVVSAENPIPLMDVLREIPPVEQVV